MITTNFYLDKKPKRKESIIFMYFRYNNKLFKISTRLKILETYWNENKQQPFAKFKRHKEYKKILNDYETQTEDIYYRLLAEFSREPYPKEIRLELKKVRNDEKTAVTFHNFLVSHLRERAIDLQDDSLGVYRTTHKHLKGYEKYKGITLTFSKIDNSFNREFSAYLYEEKGLASNTVGKYIKTLKVILNDATDKGINKFVAYKKFKVFQKSSEDAIFLDEEELNILYNLDLSEDESLNKVRDSFLVGCWTGQRFQTYSQLSKGNIIYRNGQELISVLADKTKDRVIIPLHWQVKAIIEKYNGEFPPSFTNQTTNKYLKQLGKKAGFTGEVEKTVFRGKKIDKGFVPKYELITIHTARRSFATNTTTRKENAIPPLQAMKITGHKKMSTFLGYVRTSKLRNALDLGEHDFFTKEEATTV